MASPPARSRDVTPAVASEASRHGSRPSSRHHDPGSQAPPSGSNAVPHSRGPISPPPLKKVASVVSSARAESVAAPPSDHASFTYASFEIAGALTPDRTAAAPSLVPRRGSSPSGAPTSKSLFPPVIPDTSTAPMADPSRWTAPKIAERLIAFRKEARESHAQMTAHAIASAKVAERRVFTGRDLFAGVKMTPVAENKGGTMRIKFKQHLRAKKDHKEEHYAVVCVKTKKEAVPPYRFHHVDIKKNVLTPNTMLTFVPHLRDLEGPEEAQYNLWLQELEDIDLKSGFNPLNRVEKSAMTLRAERAGTILLYLDSWLARLAMPHCTRSTLIRYMATQEPDDATSQQQQKSDRARPQQKGGHLTADEKKAAEQFSAAFRSAFEDGRPDRAAISLRRVLAFDESRDSVMDSRPAAKETASQEMCDIDEVVEFSLATYLLLGCLVCFSHSCEHGEFDNRNWKQSFSLASCSSLPDIMKQKRSRLSTVDGIINTQCKRKCYRRGISSDAETHRQEWTEDQRNVLRSLYITSENSRLRMDPICLAAEVLNRDCNDVFAEFDRLGIERPEAAVSAELKRPRNLHWYDRNRKMLLGDWQDQTITHEYQRREISEPCFHAGPCAPKICSCVDAGVLCERFCGCTVATCAYKFTGCACHSHGKVCHAKQKDRPCICVQLNRECDPELCGSCGAMRSADPLNADAGDLRESGCQNCELQRGTQKTLLLGRSQLDGVGYGLFTAEDIAQDEFVIEYVGELISHDEGVRREARRGNVFDEASNISYVFTLLDHEGIWVDAAIYGNLSRYINHASEHDTRGCNITPRILYVNGEYRIKFTALRDIEAGEELFFNYGENFPNLTKKLLDHKAAEKPDGSHKPKVGRPRHTEASDRVARKAPRIEEVSMKDRRAKTARKTVTPHATNPAHGHKADHGGVSERRKRGRPGSRDPRREARRPTDAAVSHDGDDGDYDDPDEVAERPTKRARGRAKADSSSEVEDEDEEDDEAGQEEEEEEEEDEEEDPPPRKRHDKVATKSKPEGVKARRGRPRKHPQPAEPGPSAPPKPARTAPSSKGGRMVARKTEPREVIVIEDSDDEEGDDDDDDQDVVIRSRTGRTRRMPAKFRDDMHMH